MKPPTVVGTFKELPPETKERHEAFVNFFGQHLFSMRNQRNAAIRRFVESPELREKLGNYHRRQYDSVGILDTGAQEAAIALAKYAIDLFIQDLLGLLQNSGPDLKLDQDHAFKYRLVLEIMDLNDEGASVVAEELINRGGARVLGDYFGRWLNTLSEHA